MKDKLFFVDAECDGLYGAFLSVGIVVTTLLGEELDRAYFGIRKERLVVNDEWTRLNVLPIMGGYQEVDDENMLLEKTWEFWMKYQSDSYAVADVAYPVETRLFQSCVEIDRQARMFLAPFPLMDLSNMLYLRGLEPLIERKELLPEQYTCTEHNALEDSRMSAMIWKTMFAKDWSDDGKERAAI